jgi:ABC-2 type transport system permease protein
MASTDVSTRDVFRAWRAAALRERGLLRFYVEVARTAFRRQLIYRWANLAGLLTNIFFGIVISSVFIAMYRSRPVAAGYDVGDTLRYWWLTQSMIMIVLPFGWIELLLTIRSGEVASDLSKPCDFFWYWFSREAGRDVYYALFRGLPTYAAGMLLFGLGAPASWGVWPAFLPSAILGAATGIAFRYLANIASFWIVEGRAAAGLAYVVALFFTGSYMPIAFLPPALRSVVEWLPFNGLMNVTAEIFVGKLEGAPLALGLGRQALWLLALVLTARALTTLAARRVVVQGG